MQVLLGLNERQQEAVLKTEGPLMVLAGAGSGKTKMLTARIAHLIQNRQVPPFQVLAVTFTNKAAGEMKERVSKNLASLGCSYLGDAEIGTFHSICLKILRREMARTPFKTQFVIYDDSDQLSLLKKIYTQLEISEKTLNPKMVQGAINRAKCDALEPEEMEDSAHFFGRQIKQIYTLYQKELIRHQALDFGEIICLTYRLLRDDLELRTKYQRRFRYLHVDEYQDTNRAQYLLLSLLSSKNTGGHQNICVVGDEDQSIYRWRGADIHNILDFEKDFPGATTVKLEQNYRSTQRILALASHVIRNNQLRKDKTLWTENEEGSLAIRVQLPDERAEAETVISEIKRLASEKGYSFRDFSIFYRTNAQSRQFEDVLRREKIPYQIVGGLRFYDRKEIKDILAYFKAILNPADAISLKRIINVPARGIGKTTLEKLDQLQRNTPEWQTFSDWDVLERAIENPSLTSPSVSKKLGQFVDLLKSLREAQPTLLLSELYHRILDVTGYVRDLRQEGSEEALGRIDNLEELSTVLQEFEEDQLRGLPFEEQEKKKPELLQNFIEQSSLMTDLESDPSELASIKLMTLHSSRGLEFPIVFMTGMEEGLFPSVRQWETASDEEIEEERRLCYVGITRAREQLYLTHVVVRRIWGQISYQDASRFFLEMPDELLEFRQSLQTSRHLQSPWVGTSTHSGGSGTSSSSIGSSIFGAENADPVGRSLHHPDFGRGTIIASEGTGENQRVTIQFSNSEKKKFIFRFVASYLG